MLRCRAGSSPPGSGRHVAMCPASSMSITKRAFPALPGGSVAQIGSAWHAGGMALVKARPRLRTALAPAAPKSPSPSSPAPALVRAAAERAGAPASPFAAGSRRRSAGRGVALGRGATFGRAAAWPRGAAATGGAGSPPASGGRSAGAVGRLASAGARAAGMLVGSPRSPASSRPPRASLGRAAPPLPGSADVSPVQRSIGSLSAAGSAGSLAGTSGPSRAELHAPRWTSADTRSAGSIAR
ncbi:hypothetical protein predicted by Glimmer/Critica [Sorangium cellulosum So ce56]|uniref:Uncharacterized protein n=1 Tax=Sorangium cellulosum (strain So ce56) TaxID=448385 RepID=A9FI93_SORC5|nr:hypothetical protein predicted by Glimmer/Critica [Sorangium cellulosum So ce56]